MTKTEIAAKLTRAAAGLETLKERIDGYGFVNINKPVDPMTISTKSKLDGVIRELNELAIENLNSDN